MVSATGLGERARGTGKPAKQLSSANAAPVVSQPSFLASVGTGRVCPAHQSSDKGNEVATRYLDLSRTLPITIEVSEVDPDVVKIEQILDDDITDCVHVHQSQVADVIEALSAFLKDCS